MTQRSAPSRPALLSVTALAIAVAGALLPASGAPAPAPPRRCVPSDARRA
jgi:hypothetical protein